MWPNPRLPIIAFCDVSQSCHCHVQLSISANALLCGRGCCRHVNPHGVCHQQTCTDTLSRVHTQPALNCASTTYVAGGLLPAQFTPHFMKLNLLILSCGSVVLLHMHVLCCCNSFNSMLTLCLVISQMFFCCHYVWVQFLNNFHCMLMWYMKL